MTKYPGNTFSSSLHYSYSVSPLALAIFIAMTPPALAQADSQNQATSSIHKIERLYIKGQRVQQPEVLGTAENLLKDEGVDFSAAGGVSALPVLNGLMGDRIKVVIDGNDVTSSCANHMNPPLSYIAANQVIYAKVIAGVSPVSAGGDNIAGVIKIKSLNPVFNDSDSLIWDSGNISGGYRSTNEARMLAATGLVASKEVSLSYQGNFEDANSYKDGNDNKVLDTLYQSQNHSLSAAWRDEIQQVAVKLTHQYIPYQGFANQYMDMTDNSSYGLVARYERDLANDGDFSAQVNWHSVKHDMGFFTPEKTGMMPMKTEGEDISYLLNWTLPVDESSTVLLGHEFYTYQLDDTWPAIPGSTMMGPRDYININDGKRQRAAVFAELQHTLNDKLWLSGGVRYEYVTTDAGAVQSYNTMSMMGMPNLDANAASVFNALYRERNDNIFDISLMASYQLSDSELLEIGLARKNRAPNLYERYSWGQGTMAATMIGWNGDANGYIGNIDLVPEVANTLSVAYKVDLDDVVFSTTAWYTAIDDFIDADVVRSFTRNNLPQTKRNILQFTNVDATLYGASFEVDYTVSENSMGTWDVNASINTTHGERDNSNEPLYQIKPLQATLSLQHELDDWKNSIDWEWNDAKTRVNTPRLESSTESYSLLNVKSQFVWDDVTMTLGVKNLLNEYYQMPLGGVSIAQFKQDTSKGFQQIAGSGRSVELSVSYAF